MLTAVTAPSSARRRVASASAPRHSSLPLKPTTRFLYIRAPSIAVGGSIISHDRSPIFGCRRGARHRDTTVGLVVENYAAPAMEMSTGRSDPPRPRPQYPDVLCARLGPWRAERFPQDTLV